MASLSEDAAADVRENVHFIRRRIEEAAARAGRDPDQIRLIGASKRQSLETLRAAHAAGLRIFGENRVQEAAVKQGKLPEIEHWCLIGPLQSNKVRKAVELFESVHSVDRVKIACALDRVAGELGKPMDGFLEVNLGSEDSKSGFSATSLLDQAATLEGLTSLRIVGLMTIPPPTPDPEGARHWFRELRELRDELFSRAAFAAAPGWLSMGMSGDFEVAIEEGATHVRVGTALFGERPPLGR